MTRYLTLREAAERLGLYWKTVYRLVHAGTIPAKRLGEKHGGLRISEAALEAYVKSCPDVVPGATAPGPMDDEREEYERLGIAEEDRVF